MTSVIDLIQNNYGLDGITDIVPNGSKGYIVFIGRDRYWLRSIEFSYQLNNLYYDMYFTDFLKAEGLPVRAILKTKDGKTLSNLEGKKYYMVEYFQGAFQPSALTKLTAPQTGEAARKLAQLHLLARQYKGPKNYRAPFVSQKTYKVMMEVKTIIHSRKSQDEFDALVLKAVERKLQFITRKPFENQDFLHRYRIMNHGDYHPGNIVFDQSDNIIAILDFEFCKEISRLWDIGWALTWFARINPTEAFTGSMNKEALVIFLSSYHSVFPLEIEDLDELMDLCASACYHSTYFLEHFYLRSDNKSDLTACKSLDEWFWWADNISEIKHMLVQCID